MLRLYQLANLLWRYNVPLLPKLIYIFNRICFSVVLPASVAVGKDVLFAYSGLGIVVHARCKIGNRVIVGHNVTLGGRSGYYDVPEIEDDVVIGAGAKILGPIRLGRGCKIGANAVVLNDVPAGVTVVGVPARVIDPQE